MLLDHGSRLPSDSRSIHSTQSEMMWGRSSVRSLARGVRCADKLETHSDTERLTIGGVRGVLQPIGAARVHASRRTKFTRKGKPDAGIECYWTLPTSEGVAWQAKYFLSLDSSQWGQIDESVKTALEKHPKLIRYYVCVPLDLPEARLGGQTSAFQKWVDRVAKFTSGTAKFV
jgi:hypothetical protein